MNTGRRHHHRRLLRMMTTLLLLWPSSFLLLLRRQVASSSSAYHANAFNLHHRDITLERCRHPYNIKLFDFYRTNFHEKRNKKIVPSLPRKQNDANDDSDAIFTLLLTSQQQQQHHHQGGDDTIVAALRLTKSKNDNQYTFLRSLCVSREHRYHGLFGAQHCYCFASPELERFYQKAGFFVSEDSSCSKADDTMRMFQPPKWMIYSFQSMVKRNQHKELRLYILQNNSTSSPPPPPSSDTSITTTAKATSSSKINNSTQVVLLQHHTEQAKKTATGWLLNDTQYYKFGMTIPNNNTRNKSNDSYFLVEHRTKISIWTWRGTNDVAMIEDQIRRLVQENRVVYLVWTGGTTTANTEMTTDERTICNKPAETYIIIDGTWQQAKKIYRKVPMLWSLPRITFNGEQSTYVLRGDYSGWRKKFGAGMNDNGQGNDGDLLCTAEVAAAVMDRCGDGECADMIRSRLNVYQSTFLQNAIDSGVGDESN